ncbi:MAG TPA: HAD-IIA family hydrolase [Candidatus Limnocylindrales bacterium]|jgi:HAD superfamily hydrolase (TIGR01450 family)
MSDAKRPLAMTGLRALLIDIDGVLILRGAPIPGARDALTELTAMGSPFRLATNTSALSRRSIVDHLTSVGLPVEPDRIISAASAAAEHVVARHPGGRIFLLTTPDGRSEFEHRGLHLVGDAEADRALAGVIDRHSAASVDAVVVGDASDAMTFRDLDRAFGLIRAGAAFIAMHRNRWWLTPRGTTLDAGALVAGLEYSAERRATLVGKPSPAFFGAGIRALAPEVGPPRLGKREVAMVGDDLWNDVLGAQRAGLRGIFVRSGKHGDAELAAAERQARGGGRPDVIADDLAAVVRGLRA